MDPVSYEMIFTSSCDVPCDVLLGTVCQKVIDSIPGETHHITIALMHVGDFVYAIVANDTGTHTYTTGTYTGVDLDVQFWTISIFGLSSGPSKTLLLSALGHVHRRQGMSDATDAEIALTSTED